MILLCQTPGATLNILLPPTAVLPACAQKVFHTASPEQYAGIGIQELRSEVAVSWAASYLSHSCTCSPHGSNVLPAPSPACVCPGTTSFCFSVHLSWHFFSKLCSRQSCFLCLPSAWHACLLSRAFHTAVSPGTGGFCRSWGVTVLMISSHSTGDWLV